MFSMVCNVIFNLKWEAILITIALVKPLKHYLANAFTNDLANVEANVCSSVLRPHYVANVKSVVCSPN